jgi:preprotein translocase subunit SecD
VRGFAFTLGLTTLIDLAVVVLFTHPILEILATLKFFQSGHKLSGFDIKEMAKSGYTGRGQFRTALGVTDAKSKKVAKEVQRRQTRAERKAASGDTKSEGKN